MCHDTYETGKQHGHVTTGKVIVNTDSGTWVDGKKVDTTSKDNGKK